MKKEYKINLAKFKVNNIKVKDILNNVLTVEITYDDFKFGDFIVRETNDKKIICIYKNSYNGEFEYFCEGTFYKNGEVEFMFDDSDDYFDSFRIATKEESELLLDKLLSINKIWDPEKHKINDIYIPKFGDIVKVNVPGSRFKYDYMLCIMPDKPLPNKKTDSFFDILNIRLDGKFGTKCCFTGNIEPASEELKTMFYEKLKNKNLQWNNDTKEVEFIFPKKREKHNTYYYLDKDFNVHEKFDYLEFIDDCNVRNGNYYTEEIDAIKDSIKFKNIIKRY